MFGTPRLALRHGRRTTRARLRSKLAPCPARREKTVIVTGKSPLGIVYGECADLAGRQDGLVTRDQLLSLGATAGAIDHWLRAGRLHEVHRGVYTVGHCSLPRRGRLRAASMVGPDVCLSHISAAEWWAIVGPRTGHPHITAPRRITRPRLIAHHRALPADEIEGDDGVRLTSVSRTLFDLAALGDRQLFESALRKAEFRQLGGRLSLADLIERYPRARGVVLARTVLEQQLYRLPTESWLEDVFLPFLVARRFEMPLVNPTIQIRGDRYRPDCLWPRQRLIAELDGRAGHAGELGFESDRVRDAALLGAGYRIMRITKRRFEISPDAVDRDLRDALAARVVLQGA